MHGKGMRAPGDGGREETDGQQRCGERAGRGISCGSAGSVRTSVFLGAVCADWELEIEARRKTPIYLWAEVSKDYGHRSGAIHSQILWPFYDEARATGSTTPIWHSKAHTRKKRRDGPARGQKYVAPHTRTSLGRRNYFANDQRRFRAIPIANGPEDFRGT
jgi:hypothetical protein